MYVASARRELLLTPDGRIQTVYREGVLQDMAAAAAAVEGQPSEAAFRKQLVRRGTGPTWHVRVSPMHW